MSNTAIDYRKDGPTFQEYAPDMLSNRNFRRMSLAERGLLSTMRLECWVGGSVPAHPEELARVVGANPDDVLKTLTPAVLTFFAKINGELICPDLEKYRKEQRDRRARLSEGGRAGGRKTQSKIRDQAILEGRLEAPLEGGPIAPLEASERRGEEGRRGERRRVIKDEQLLEVHKEWVAEFDGLPVASKVAHG